jgi:ribosomal protein S6
MSLTATRNYRATVILNTQGYQDPVETLVEKMKTHLEDLGAEVSKTENLGHKDFVSGAVKRHAGDIFLLIDFSSAGNVPSALQEKVRLDSTIKRLHINRA